MQRFLAIDFGAESGRAMLATLNDGRITLDEAHRFPTRNGRLMGTFQWDLLSLWEDVKQGLRIASQRLEAGGGGRLAGIGVDTWGVDYTLIDEFGRPLANPVHYRDGRTDGAMDRLFAEAGREEVFGVTGIQFMALNTIFQLYAQSRTEAGKRQLEQARRMLFMPDTFHYLLSGRMTSELTIASTSQLLDARTRQWATPLLSKLQLPAHLLGEIVPPGTQVGGLLPDIARECGAASGTPIIAPASHDTASAVAAVPVARSEEGWAYLSSGTWSLLGVESDEPVIDDRTLSLNYTNEQGAGGKVRLLKNIMGLWLVQETRRDLARRGAEFSYAQLTELAGQSPPLRTLLDTWHAPFASPGDYLSKIEGYARSTGQDVPTTPGAFVRACLDSLALTYRAVLDHLEKLTGKSIHTLHIVGGGTQNKLLNQLTADATGRRVIAGPVEATAVGNVMTQALGTGVVASLAEAREIVARSFELETYEPCDTAGFEAAYPTFRQLAGM